MSTSLRSTSLYRARCTAPGGEPRAEPCDEPELRPDPMVVVSRAITPPAAIVLGVRELREQVRAGMGSASFSMRVLDNVSLQVHAGQLLIVRGGIASGASPLVSVLAGIRPVRSGVRVIAHGVVVRRATIPLRALRALVTAWEAPLRRIADSSTPTVFVVRVHDATEASGSAEPWRAWATALRARQGSMVVHLPWDEGGPDDGRSTESYRGGGRIKKQPSPTVHEAAVGDGEYQRTNQTAVASVRVVTLAGGRIVSVDPMTRQTLMVRGGEGASPSVWSPYSRAWTGS